MTLILHHLETSRSMRILWLLEELGLDYELKTSQRDPKTMFGPADHQKLHPQGSWPLIQDGDLTLPESGAIVEYVINKAGAESWRRTPDQADWPDYLRWMHFAEATLQPYLLMHLVFSKLPKQAPAMARPIVSKVKEGVEGFIINPKVELYMKMIEAHLTGKDSFLEGGLTGADVMMIFPLESVFARIDDAGKKYPNTKKYVQGIHGRPAFKAALEKGGEYKLAPLQD
ncbi:glutathione S-transferase family protein [Parvularcula bermudensis HTCC2503]|uniref:Glutathione S-transferase family protein n=1 Tax=Parvularcula bermudensis (strain ATCC BAA-594 / HTCC2503 / KCTC 12087) TaxID=314260 RepID=E0TIC9_PARBH|nr:glutathione S-transferase [Parvularcula bermudensis]ADM09713.1 glutathione S-transferase family protein [Parvularcula bermudensis HTCC2503]